MSQSPAESYTAATVPSRPARPARKGFVRYPEFHYRWVWKLQSSPEALWPLVADTNRFNRDTGVPAIERRDAPGGDVNNARRLLRLYRLGIPVDWEEEPFEWVRPYRFGVVRRYSRGPVAEMRVVADLNPQPDGSTEMVYQVWARPRNPLGLLAIPVQMGLISGRAFARTVHQYDQFMMAGGQPETLLGEADLAPGGRKRLQTLVQSMIAEGANRDILAHLSELVERGDEISLARMRPYALADLWGVDRRETLEHFLRATRRGLLELRWEVICPLCRNPKLSAENLGGLRSSLHCEVCHVDFATNLDQSVEVTFRPNAAIRESVWPEFCIAGPQLTPHVVVQQLLKPGETREVTPALESGRYRVRTLGLRGGEYLRVVMNGGQPQATVRASAIDGWPDGELTLTDHPILALRNTTDDEQLFILERMAWSDQAATAAEVTTLQAFRDLFSNEALRPGEQLSVGSLAIVFTDLCGSTRLYNEIGDAPAFGVVLNHFDVLRAAIDAEGGAIVKTIGDAVMAVFRRPAPAFRAMRAAQAALVQASTGRPLQLRAGIHYGPCIAVTLNERLDYFGSTVNLAARLETLSSGEDVILSDAAVADPEVSELLETGRYNAQPFTAPLKGFEGMGHALWRVVGTSAR